MPPLWRLSENPENPKNHLERRLCQGFRDCRDRLGLDDTLRLDGTLMLERRQAIFDGQLNTGMSHEINTYSKNDTAFPRWVVQFSFKFRDDAQRRAVEGLGLLAHEVVRIWLDVVVPDASVNGPPGTPIQQVFFRRRANARRFMSCWGGRLRDPVQAFGLTALSRMRPL
jgi:hypothetical protein